MILVVVIITIIIKMVILIYNNDSFDNDYGEKYNKILITR